MRYAPAHALPADPNAEQRGVGIAAQRRECITLSDQTDLRLACLSYC